MIELSVYNTDGERIDSIKVDESAFGGRVRESLLKQAIVMYQANKRVGTATTKGRGDVAGSTRKLFKQKGTGFARAGTIRTGKRVGGGVTFAKQVRDFGRRMPRKQKKAATNSAVLKKLLNESVFVVDGLKLEKPRTKDFASVLENLKILNKGSCLVTVASQDQAVYKSARNIPRVDVICLGELNAGDVCNHKLMLFTREAFMSLVDKQGERQS